MALFPTWASAFYYEEHKLITQEALDIVAKSGGLMIDQELIKRGIKSSYLCKDLLDPAPGQCFTLADLPALAGDHAGSPLLMQWKWLDRDGIDGSHSIVLDGLALMKVFFEEDCTSSETTISKVPNRLEFSESAHTYPNAQKFATNGSLSDADNNYARSAGHNCNHFRINHFGNIRSASLETDIFYIFDKPKFIPHFVAKHFESAQSNIRHRERPALTANAWYAQLHAAALELASYRTETHNAAAWLFETFALHFVQDGISAGHIDTPADGGGSVIFVTKPNHDTHSENGIKVSFDAACKKLATLPPAIGSEFVALKKSCAKVPYEGNLFGDKNMEKDDTGLTKDLAVFMTYVSLKEFGDAMKNRTPLLPDQNPEGNFKSDPFWTYDSIRNQELAKKLFSWWESGGRSEKSSPMKLAAEKYFDDGKLEALFLWPIPSKRSNREQTTIK